MKEIRNVIDTPLVLHGGSGLPEKDLKDCITNGITKVNIFTDLYAGAEKAIKNCSGNYHDIRASKVESIRETVAEKIMLFGSNGRA